MKKILKRPLIVFICLFALLIVCAIPTSYIIIYNTNHNNVFNERNVKISKQPDDFDLSISFLSKSEATTDKQGSFRMNVECNNFKKDITKLNITFGFDCDWTSCNGYSSTYKINDGNKIFTVQDPEFSRKCYAYIKTVFPVNPLLFVSIKEPNVYAKVSYTIETSNIGIVSTEEKVFYLKYTPSYYNQSIAENESK